MGVSRLYFDGNAEVLYTENESNAPRLWNFGQDRLLQGCLSRAHRRRAHRSRESRAPRHQGRRLVSVHDRRRRQAGISLAVVAAHASRAPFEDFDSTLAQRQREADAYYADLQKDMHSADERVVQRQAFAGLIWNKQFYYLDVPRWLKGDPGQPKPPDSHLHGRNADWRNLNNADILSMPDNWEYPWYASWDLAFHCIPFALIDAAFAKHQLVLLTREWYMHPNGQIPAYEWAFSDVNPPVHAWATWRVYQIDRKQNGGKGDLEFLERVFHKLMLNFTWWVNRKDNRGPQYFPGRILGPGQHRRIRPQRAVAHRRLHQSIRRHQLDGDVCAEPHAHRAGALRTQSCVRGHRQQILRAFLEYRRGDELHVQR